MPLNRLALHDLTEAVLGCVCAALQATAEEFDGRPGCRAEKPTVLAAGRFFDQRLDSSGRAVVGLVVAGGAQ
ncbi:hypothetical protein [Streptomyces halobius]|uniref:Glycerate kinase n=1 Tax=Streptomyces halobius TaxID=2879846 RepID=A0ABY4MBX1_9ACTN|nr:hypothetical protein [Streptomyces halobius]UQA94817.1 hypothetical protein K9S39_25800 [Streptomyces halobius]